MKIKVSEVIQFSFNREINSKLSIWCGLHPAYKVEVVVLLLPFWLPHYSTVVGVYINTMMTTFWNIYIVFHLTPITSLNIYLNNFVMG